MTVVARLDQYSNLLAGEFDEITRSTPGITNSGVFYADEFSENLETTQLVANTFLVYDPLTTEFAMPTFGAGQGTYMRHTSTGTCITYGEIDEITSMV